MGFLKRFFGNNKSQINSEKNRNSIINEKESLKTIESNSNQYKNTSFDIKDILLVYLCDRIIVGDYGKSEYYYNKYGISFLNERLKKLEHQGYIRIDSSKESIGYLKLVDLKEIAKTFDIKTSGKKAEICKRIIDNVSEDEIEKYISERHWRKTEAGEELLKKYPYVDYYMEKHEYYLDNIGMDLNYLSKLFTANVNGRVRDVIWGELNRKTIEYYSNAFKTGKFNDFCALLEIKALFLEEEKNYKDALRMYVEYINYIVNFKVSLSVLLIYRNDMKSKYAVEFLFDEMKIEIYPFVSERLMRMCNECEFDSNQFKQFILDVLLKQKDTGMFSPDELTQFLFVGFDGNEDEQKKICKRVMNKSYKQVNSKR